MSARDEKSSDKLPQYSLIEMRFKQVVVVANSFIYRGQLLGADESELYLKGLMRYLVLPMELVTSIRLADASLSFDPKKIIPDGFYEDEDQT